MINKKRLRKFDKNWVEDNRTIQKAKAKNFLTFCTKRRVQYFC